MYHHKAKKTINLSYFFLLFYIGWQKMGSTITKPKKLQIPCKISLKTIIERRYPPSRSQKNYKSRVKFLFILNWVAKNAFYHQEVKKTTNHTFFLIGRRKTGSTITKPKKSTNPT